LANDDPVWLQIITKATGAVVRPIFPNLHLRSMSSYG
jgi:hypothetical protein